MGGQRPSILVSVNGFIIVILKVDLPSLGKGACWRLPDGRRDFAAKLVDVQGISRCPILGQERFKDRAEKIAALLAVSERQEEIADLLDGLRADFALAPLPGEPSCREDLHPFNPEARPTKGELLRYRPLGCPITHFARVLN